MRINTFSVLSVSLFVLFFVWGCNTDHKVKVSVENTTPVRTELSLQPDHTTVTLAKDVSQEQLRVISWMYLQQMMYNDYAIRLAHQQQIEKDEQTFQSWVAFVVCLVLGGLAAWYLYLQYCLKRGKRKQTIT